MNRISRRKLITGGVAVVAGASGLAAAANLVERYDLVPPDGSGPYGPGETLTYAAQRLLTRHSLAREFAPTQISKTPFANAVDPLGEEFKRLQDGAFADWPLMEWSPTRHRSRLLKSKAVPPAAKSLIWPAKKAGLT